MQTKTLLHSALCGALLVSFAQIALAEGSLALGNAHGINRRVATSRGGQTQASGNVDLSVFQPINNSGDFDVQVNPFNDKATAYFGGSAILRDGTAREVEGGLQFETGVRGAGWTPGWHGFIARADGGHNVYINPLVVVGGTPVEWVSLSFAPKQDSQSHRYIGCTGQITTFMDFSIIPGGSYSLKLDCIGSAAANHTFYWIDPARVLANDQKRIPGMDPVTHIYHPIAPWSNESYNSPNQNSSQVGALKSLMKRVSGLTRSTVANDDQALDGAWTQSVWTGCTVDGGSWAPEVDNSNAVTATGFNGPAATVRGGAINTSGWDGRLGSQTTIQSHPLVDFSFTGITNTNHVQAQEQPINDVRYDDEKVIVNARTATHLSGSGVEW